MKLPPDFRKLKKGEIYEAGDWVRIERGLYLVMSHWNAVGSCIGAKVTKRCRVYRQRRDYEQI